MTILLVLLACLIGAWVFSGFRGGQPSRKALSAMFASTGAFLLWWIPMAYLELRGGIERYPELDVVIRRLALTGALIALASAILAAKNPTKSLWINTSRAIGWIALALGLVTVLFAAP